MGFEEVCVVEPWNQNGMLSGSRGSELRASSLEVSVLATVVLPKRLLGLKGLGGGGGVRGLGKAS